MEFEVDPTISSGPNIYNNTDNNSDGPLLSRVDVDELADTLFLLFTDNELHND